MNELKGFVDHVIYRNAENGYTVMVLDSDGMEITCVGNFQSISEGENLKMPGEYITHVTYGEQFKMISYEVTTPEDAEAMRRYLASGAVKGVGQALADRIVKKFKADTFRIMEEEPERLAEIKGISLNKAMEIAEQMTERKDLRDAMVFLAKYGINNQLAVKVYNQYGPTVYKIIQENPYRLADDISGVGFKIADEIATRVGINTDSDFRIQSGIIYTLSLAAGQGHTYLPKDRLVNEAADILQIDVADIEPHIMNLAIDKKLVLKDDNVYARVYYHMEEMSAGMLLSIDEFYPESESRILTSIAHIEKEENLELDDMQRRAVMEAATHGVFVLTGGPGTGKTTTIKAIIKYFENEGCEIYLAAPTGRAAKRMSEATGYEARTIHRMLEVKSGSEEDDDPAKNAKRSMFERNETNPLETDVVIIDEMSMVDMPLFYALLKAVADKTRLILVGDSNQLPSVGPGNVLRDIINSECFSTVCLNKIFRQASESDIVVNAHHINQGEHVDTEKKSEDFFLMKRYEADRIISVAIQLIQKNLPPYVGAKSFDIQVLTPTRKGNLGVERLNTILQQYLNPADEGKKEIEYGNRIFREGDKVMQIKNNYQLEWEIQGKYGIPTDKGLGVFNGDMGIVKEINTYMHTLTVCFDDGHVVEYSVKALDELELAYAITIHKSQGSEYPAVIIPLLPGPRMLMNRNLLYTAVTRAKKCVVIVGDDGTFNEMIENNIEQKRFSGFCNRIKEIHMV